MKAYRIVNWKMIGEVTDKGKAAQMDTPDEKIRKVKPQYIRWRIQGHSLSPARRRLSRKAWTLGKMMDVWCDGIYIRLLDLAGDWDDPNLRGLILDDRKRPMNPYQVADLFEIKDTEHIQEVFDLLCDPDIGLLEKVEFSGSALVAGESGGDLGEAGEKRGEEEKLFLNETEAKEESLNYETESDSPGFPDEGGKAGELTAAPASALDSDTVSDSSASVSGSAPRQGLRSVEEIKEKSAEIMLDICKLIKPRDQSDRTTLHHIFIQLRKREIYVTDELLFEHALKKAKECCRIGKNPIGMFVAAMKKSPFCYIPQKESTIKGATDKYRKRQNP